MTLAYDASSEMDDNDAEHEQARPGESIEPNNLDPVSEDIPTDQIALLAYILKKLTNSHSMMVKVNEGYDVLISKCFEGFKDLID